MSPKTPSMTTLNIPRPSPEAGSAAPADFASQWQAARLVYPIYAALATQFEIAPLPYATEKLPPEKPTRETFDGVLSWLGTIDQKTLAYQIRQLPSNILNASEAALRALILRQLKKEEKTTADRDKIDLLLVQYFAMCASDELVHREITLEDVARILQPVLSEADPTPLEWCAPLETILDKTRQCQSLRDMMEDGLLEQGRLLKDEAGVMFYDPAALVAFTRFNFMLRRAFIRMLHADLSAVRDALNSLEAQGVKTVDCRRAGFSAAETTMQLRYFSENWRQPFQKDYTESSVRHSFEQLLNLRADLEDALGHREAPSKPKPALKAPTVGSLAAHHEDDMLAMMSSTPADVTDPLALEPVITKKEKAARDEAIEAEVMARAEAEEKAQAAQSSSPHAAKPAADAPAAPTAAAEAEKCMEQIWEQLIAVPPSRGRSMSTVVLQDTKVLLSSWEVAAFVEKGSQESEDLRRAVVARALLALASDKRKRSGEERALASALALARTEVSYFQGRVEQAKKAKNTEAAVNLGISTKRLLSCIEEAETLQS